MAAYTVPLIIRGGVIRDDAIPHGGRRGGVSFASPDVKRHLAELPLARPSSLRELYSLSLDDILDFLAGLAARLDFRTNLLIQQAFELSCHTSGLTEATLRSAYERLPAAFDRAAIRELVDRTIGIPYLEGWVSRRLDCGAVESIRAIGSRSVHVIAGNVPTVSAMTLVRNAVTRGDAIIKTPSNDPLTAAAIVETMVEFAPDHPLTRHVSVAYWKGGDREVEEALYQPRNVEKIVAWGGFASVKHIANYLQPGIDLLTLDPKLSSSIIGREAFADDATMREVAARLANDVGAYNQEACVNARVVYAQTGTDPEGIRVAERLGGYLFDAIQNLPPQISGVKGALDATLADEIETLKLTSEDHLVIGGDERGGVIVSRLSEPVDFSRLLAQRVANIVPFDDLETPVGAVTAYTQTIGIFPEGLKTELRDLLAFHGGQRMVTLGYAPGSFPAGAQDGVEPLRRMCKWILDEATSPDVLPIAARRFAVPVAEEICQAG